MARTWDGIDDVIKCSIGGCNLTPPISVASLIRLNSDTVTQPTVNLTDSAETVRVLLYVLANDGRVIYESNGNGDGSSSVRVFVADGWVLIGADKASGVNNPRFHRYIYSTNVWTHSNGNTGTIGNNTAPGSTGKVLHGKEGTGISFFNGEIALTGIWNRRLSDAEWETLPFSLMHWHATAPVGLWLFDQSLTTQNVADFTGNGANQTAITGTAVATNHPPVFNRGHPVISVTREAAAAAGGHPTMRRWGGIPGMVPGRLQVGRGW